MYILIISIFSCTTDSSQGNLARKRKKKHPDCNEKVKLSLFTNDSNLYRENPKEFAENTKVNKFSEVTGYKSNIQNQLYFWALVTHSPKMKFRKQFYSQ